MLLHLGASHARELQNAKLFEHKYYSGGTSYYEDIKSKLAVLNNVIDAFVME